MKKLKIVMMLLAPLMGIFAAKANLAGEWKHYPSFDVFTNQVVDTPDALYFTMYPQKYIEGNSYAGDPGSVLFAYYKKSDELRGLTKRDNLSDMQIQKMAYNPDKGYMLLVYDNLNIDFLYDDGRVENIAALKNANMPGARLTYQITFDPEKNAAYIPTDFGYVKLDDNKHEISESRNYGERIWSVVRAGEKILVAADRNLYIADIEAPRFNLGEYAIIPGLTGIEFMQTLDPEKVIMVQGNTIPTSSYAEIITLDKPNNSFKARKFLSNVLIYELIRTKRGYMLRHETGVVGIDKTTQAAYSVTFPAEDKKKLVTSYDDVNWWKLEGRKGLMSYKLDGTQWTVTRDYMLPNSPAAYISYAMAYSPKYGTLVGSRGNEGRYISALTVNIPQLISGHKDGEWTEYSTTWRLPTRPEIGTDFRGLTIDQDDPDWVYRGSTYNGIIKQNLKDPSKVVHMSRPTDPDAVSTNDFVSFVDVCPAWGALANFSAPKFDSSGNLICLYNWNNQTARLYRWSPENRKATVNAATYKPWEFCDLPIAGKNSNLCLPLRHKASANKLVIISGLTIYVVDHKGTFSNPNDDEIYSFTSAVNQDGTTVPFAEFYSLYEDEDTGLVWVGTRRGLFTFNPRTIAQTGVVNQVKVSRDDGTSLADYLLNEVSISNIMDDGQGRKWFSTNGGGLVVTSSDGRKILAEFTKANSMLPDDIVYGTCYNPDSNSVMVSTDSGLAEFFISGGGNSTAESTVRAYPNPVAPDYYGYVTIDNLPDNSLVKIMDSNGGIVRDLGVAESGSVQWDVMNMEYKRVKTGVYYILVSGSGDGGSTSSVGKILIMN